MEKQCKMLNKYLENNPGVSKIEKEFLGKVHIMTQNMLFVLSFFSTHRESQLTSSQRLLLNIVIG